MWQLDCPSLADSRHSTPAEAAYMLYTVPSIESSFIQTRQHVVMTPSMGCVHLYMCRHGRHRHSSATYLQSYRWFGQSCYQHLLLVSPSSDCPKKRHQMVVHQPLGIPNVGPIHPQLVMGEVPQILVSPRTVFASSTGQIRQVHTIRIRIGDLRQDNASAFPCFGPGRYWTTMLCWYKSSIQRL